MLKFISGLVVAASMLVTGCASVPMASKDKDDTLKSFANPPKDKSGVYIYRDTFGGQALKKSLSIDGTPIGETANKVYFYKEIAPGTHKLSTESEFSDNQIDLQTEGGKNYFVEQYIKLGVFVGGANLKVVTESEGRRGVLACNLAAALPGQDSTSVSNRSASTVATARVNQSAAPTNTATADALKARYMFQAEKLSSSLGCTATAFVSSGPGVEFYTTACNTNQVSIRCDFGRCAAQ